MAVKQMILRLIQQNLICLGLKNKAFLLADHVDKHSSKYLMHVGLKKDTFCTEERGRRLKRDVRKMSKRMQTYLHKDEFDQAVSVFVDILKNKSPDWNEISQMWSYVTMNLKSSQAKKILEILSSGTAGVASLFKEAEEKDKSGEGVDQAPLDNIKLEFNALKQNVPAARMDIQNKLKFLYGFGRLNCHNPYDLVDFDNYAPMDYENHSPNISTKLDAFEDPTKVVSDLEELEKRMEVLTTDQLETLIQFEEEAKLGAEGVNSGVRQPPQSSEIASGGLATMDAQICNLRIDQTTGKEFKDANSKYLTVKMVNEMYDTLLYSGELSFSVRMAEMIYSISKLDDAEFISPYAAYYYAHRKNLLQIDFLESVYKTYLNLEYRDEGLVQLTGKLSKIGYKFKQQVLVFKPDKDPYQNLDEKIVRRGVSVGSEIQSIRDDTRLNEREVVLLVAFSEEVDQAKGDPELDKLLEEETGGLFGEDFEKKASLCSIKDTPFFKRRIASGKKVSEILFATVSDISKDYCVKLCSLPSVSQGYKIEDTTIHWTMVRLPVNGRHAASQRALLEYTTKNFSNPSIAHIIMCPPLTSPSYLEQLYSKRADLQLHQSQKTKNQVKMILENLNQSLDDSQLDAVGNALCKSLSLVEAPSVSGKLACIVQVASAWLSLSTATILVCAESNIKVDMLHMALTKAGIVSVRLMASQDQEDAGLITSDFENVVESMKENSSYFNSYYVRYPILKKIISNASVVCTTLDAMSGEYFNGCSFPRVIVDDAASVSESLVLSAFVRNCQHAVLLGDQKALPPKSVSHYAVSKGAKLSLFER